MSNYASDLPWSAYFDESQARSRMYGFSLCFDNSKSLRRGGELRKCRAFGVVFPSKHVFVDTSDIRPDYRNLAALEAYLATFGEYQFNWIGPSPLSQDPIGEAEPAQDTRGEIHCSRRSRPHGKPLQIGRFDQTGVYFMCKLCRQPHRLSRAACLKLWEELDRQTPQTR